MRSRLDASAVLPQSTGYDDVFTRCEKAREHFTKAGFGAEYVDRFIR